MTITSRIDGITKIDAAHSGVFISAPRSVKVELTANCNYRCGFCVKSLRRRPSGLIYKNSRRQHGTA